MTIQHLPLLPSSPPSTLPNLYPLLPRQSSLSNSSTTRSIQCCSRNSVRPRRYRRFWGTLQREARRGSSLRGLRRPRRGQEERRTRRAHRRRRRRKVMDLGESSVLLLFSPKRNFPIVRVCVSCELTQPSSIFVSSRLPQQRELEKERSQQQQPRSSSQRLPSPCACRLQTSFSTQLQTFVESQLQSSFQSSSCGSSDERQLLSSSLERILERNGRRLREWEDERERERDGEG